MSVMTGYEISQKNGLSTSKLFWLAIITNQAFLYYWMKKMTELVEAFSGKRVWKDSAFIILLSLLLWVPFICLHGALDLGSSAFFGIMGCFFLAGTIMIFQWSFSMRREITLYAITKLGMSEYKMNAFYTLIFNVYYINYCLNDLGDEDLLQRAREDQRVRQMKTLQTPELDTTLET